MKHWTSRKSIKVASVLCMMLLLCLTLCVGCDEQTDHTHAWKDWEIIIQPTCESKGSQERVCSECNEKEQSYITALGHDLEKNEAKVPTCTETGCDAYEACKRCNYTTYAEKAALGHDLTKHEAKAPTCTEAGYDAYETCGRCDHTTYTEKAALGHDVTKHEAKAPTCTAAGYDAYETCGRCDHTTYAEKAALGHDLTEHEAKAPTCTEAGYDAYETCGRCDHTTYAEKAALGHDVTKHEAKAPTCTEAGYDAYETCSRCNHTTYAEKDAIGHQYQMGECQHCGDKDESFREETITPVDDNLMPVPEDSVNLFGYVKTVVDAWGNCLFYGVYLPDGQSTARIELTYGPDGPLSMAMYEVDELVYKCEMTYDDHGSILSMTRTGGEESVTYQFASVYDAAGLLVSQVLTVPEYEASLEIKYEHLEDGTWKATYEDGAYGSSYICKGWFNMLKVIDWSPRYYREEMVGIMPPVLSYFVPDYWLTTVYIKYTSEGEISYKEETTYNERFQELSTIRTDGAGNLIEKSGYEYRENGNRKSFSTYDASGKCTEWETYDENGNLTAYGWFWDRNGDGIYDKYSEGVGYKNEYGWYSRLEKLSITYDEEGNVMGSARYEHDERGRTILETEYDADGNILSSLHLEYDDHDQIISFIRYDENGNVLTAVRYEYEYYENGSIKKRVSYDANDHMTEWEEFSENERPVKRGVWYDRNEDGIYDEYSEYVCFEAQDGWLYNLCVLTMEYGEDGELEYTWEYEYNEMGVRIYETCKDANGFVVKREEYDSDGNPLKFCSWYDADDDGVYERYSEFTYRKAEYGWDSMLIFSQQYGKDGELEYTWEYEYNEMGVLTYSVRKDGNGNILDETVYG